MKPIPPRTTVRSFLESLQPPRGIEELSAWGWTNARTLTNAVDGAVLAALGGLDPSRIGLYAVGGYGRRELAPFSDVDLLFVPTGDVELGDVIAGLWNLGFKPSILIRSLDQVRTSAAEDLHFATTITEARWLWGLEFAQLLGSKTWIAEVRPDIERELERERIARHLRHRGAGHQEPNVREGQGGLRDLQGERWVTAALGSPSTTPGLDDATRADYGVLLAARLVAHAALNRREDRLTYADREAISPWLGWEDPGAFYRAVFETLRRSALRRRHAIEGTPSRPTREAFLRRLTYSLETPVGHFLRECDESGVLGELVPEWRRITCLPRGDLAHWFTPEEHTLRVIERLETLMRERKGLELKPDLVRRHDLLLLAALFHDIGKGSGRDHSEAGREICTRVLGEWKYPESDIETVAFLVGEHQVLSYHAFYRDIDDPWLIHALARRIGDSERLAMLYFLTVADIQSVSDESWTDWKANLLNTLTNRLARQCQYNLPPDRLARESVWRRRTAVTRILRDDRWARTLNHHFANIDARYALGHTPEQIAHHIQLLPRLEAEEVVIEKTIDTYRGFGEVIVITRTHTGLFAEIAGTLSARGFNILEAHIATRQDGVAIDSFKVSIEGDGGISDEDRWKSFERDLRRVLSGQARVEDLIARRMPYLRRTASPRPPVVTLDNESSATHTVVEVMAPDEPGLLFRLARAFRDCGLGITSAIVTTEAGLGVDVFYVTHEGGGKITDSMKTIEIETALTRPPMPESTPA